MCAERTSAELFNRDDAHIVEWNPGHIRMLDQALVDAKTREVEAYQWGLCPTEG